MLWIMALGFTMPPETKFDRFRRVLELIGRFEFEFCRLRELFFLKDSNFWCVHVNVPWLVCTHAIPLRMLWLARFMMTNIYISMKTIVEGRAKAFVNLGERQIEH